MLWSFSPFVTAQKRFYTAVLFSRLLMVLVSKWLRCHVATPLPPCTCAFAKCKVCMSTACTDVLRHAGIRLIMFLSTRFF